MSNNYCYEWTFDPAVDNQAVAPTLDSIVQTPLTSGTVKVYASACAQSVSWSGTTAEETFTLANPGLGIDCQAEFVAPKNVAQMDYLVVAGGGAGGYASLYVSQGGGGGGGGGMAFSATNASVTPGRIYPVQVGAGATVGANTNGAITCLHGNAGDSSATAGFNYGGTSKFGGLIAQGGGCAYNTGGNESGSDGGISANGRTGGRGGSCNHRLLACNADGHSSTLNTTSYYTTSPLVNQTPIIYNGSTGIDATGAYYPSVGDQNIGLCDLYYFWTPSSGACGVNYNLNAWEGAGGGGGAYYDSTTSSAACDYGNPHWSFIYGCDGYDIGGVGSLGGRGGDGIKSWYPGFCNNFYGGGGGGGGSTPNDGGYGGYNSDGSGYNSSSYTQSNSGNSNMGTSYNHKVWYYSWNGTTNTTQWSSMAVLTGTGTTTPYYAHPWMALGGFGGKGGGGQAATSEQAWQQSAPGSVPTYLDAQNGTDGCGGGGGGGQAFKGGIYGYSSSNTSMANLNVPGRGGNGMAIFRFSVSGAYYDKSFNPDVRVPSVVTVWPKSNYVQVPIYIKQSNGKGVLCIGVTYPNDTTTLYPTSAPLKFAYGGTDSATVYDTGTTTSLNSDVNGIRLHRTNNSPLIRSSDAWANSSYFYLNVRYSGSDSIANDSCSNSALDYAYGMQPLTQIVKVVRINASLTYGTDVAVKP